MGDVQIINRRNLIAGVVAGVASGMMPKPKSEIIKVDVSTFQKKRWTEFYEDSLQSANFWDEMAHCIEETPDPPKPQRCS